MKNGWDMPAKTPGDEYLHKTWKRQTRIFLALVIFSAIFLSIPASATHAHSVVVFTDKKTYMGWWVNPVKNGAGYAYAGADTAPLEIYVYAMVLSDKGTIIKGEEGQVSGFIADYKRLAPGQASGHHTEYFGEIVFGNNTLTFVDDGSLSGDTAGDGIYVAKITLDKTKGSTLVGDHLVMNVTVSYPGMASNTQQILITGWYCMQNGIHSGDGHGTHTDQTGTSANCAVCHHGYEHWYENVSRTFSDDQLDVHVFKTNPPDVDGTTSNGFDSNRWNYSDDGGAGGLNTFEAQVPGSKYCAFCHEVTGSATYDYGAGDRSNPADRPVCNNSNCHNTTEIANTTVPSWNPAALGGLSSLVTRANYNITKAEKHAHDSSGVDTVPCASCHRTTHSLELPNRTSSDYTDLSGRCLSCHSLFNKHNSSVSCIKCHTNDTHNIRFLQQNLSYDWSTTNVVTCDNCHTNTTFAGALNLNPPQVPYTNHSGDSDAGQKWGDYWTSKNQQAAVGGSTLIESNTSVVFSQSALYGTASPLSGAQTADASFETLTESTKSVPPVDYYTYVDSNSTPYGTVTNWGNIQNASDGTAFANFTEVLSGAGSATYFGSSTKTAGTTTNAGNVASIDAMNATLYTTGDSVSAGIWGSGDIGIGNITTVNLFTRLSAAAPPEDGIELYRIDYDIGGVAGPAGTNAAYTTSLANYSRNVTTDRSWKWDDIMKLNATVVMTVSGGDAGDINVDAIWVRVNYTSASGLASTMLFTGVPVSDKYYLETSYKTAGDTYDIYVYDGKNWTDRGNLTATTFTVFNITLSNAEYNSGSPKVLIRDKNATASTGNISIDYLRIHGWTADTSHQEINLNHNFTGIPKYAAQETAEYTLLAKGYVTAGEGLDIYAYDYGTSSYQLVKVDPFPTTNGWVNYSIPYTAISDTGNASIQFRDANKTRYDNVVNNFYLDYVAIKADNYKYLPCFYCHALLANHKKRALGNIEWVQTGATENNLKNSTNLSGYWCANCHYNGSTASGKYKYNGSAWSPAPPLITFNNVQNNSGSWYNHSGDVVTNYTDAKCKECHGTAAINTTKQFPHSVEVGSSGGANCTNCHNIGGSAGTGKLVNFTAMNDTNAIHKNLNKDRTTNLPAENKRCWACHGNGSEPGSGHPTNYKTPYKCVDCHVPGVGQNMNYTPNAILNVTQHYWNGTNITTSAASCYSCHNRTEMMAGISLDPDGAAGVYGGANGGNNSSSHYGLKRSNLGGYSQDTNGYCNYCHNTTINNATFYVSDFNNTIFNHSARTSTPLCSACHSTGKLHNVTLAKPVSNDSYCSTCHGAGGTAATSNKTRHRALNCTECHANNSVGALAGKDIHAIKYLTQSNTFTTSNSSAVNCVTCHQTTSVDSSLGSFSAFKIQTPMRHSDNISNGSVWDSYWTNTSPQTDCIYCHNNTLHNATPLGRILQWAPNYNMYGAIGTNITCSDCHYKSDNNYTQMNSSFASAGLKTPPEITNGTSWKGNSSNYYNHSLSAYDDSTCKSCHGALLSGSANMSEFMHNVAVGVNGGANCTACHNIGGSAGAGKLVNFSAMNDSIAIHRNLNSADTSNMSLPAENRKCWACHGNGSAPSDHPSNYKTPYNCTSCHIQGAGQNMNFTPKTILNVTQHYWNGTSIDTANATSCYICHNKTEMMVGLTLDPDGSSTVYGGANGGNLSVSHYSKRRSDMAVMANLTYCNYCHNNASSVFPFINNSNKTIANHSVNYASTNPECKECHEAGRLHNSTLYKPAFALPNSSYCLICHGSSGSATIKNLERHNSTSQTALNCTQCHLNSSKSIHPARYLQQNSAWDTSKTNAVNCTTCHQGSGMSGFNTAPITPKPMNHSTNSYSGALWNNTQPAYWTNTSQQSSCDYCHGKIAYHNNSGLGDITKVKGGNKVRQDLDTSRWCANCHYKNSPGYAGSDFYPEPPEILNLSGKVPNKARDNTNFYNHSQDLVTGYNDSKCRNCHNNSLAVSATSLNFSHNLVPGGGGANCTSCHYIGASVQNVNITAMSDASFIHKDLNKNASASDNGYNSSKKCWACHSEDGKEPSGHPARYKNPFNCADCHVQGAGQNFNYIPNNTILNVTQHYWNGTSIGTANATSCYVCHNKSEMMLGLTLDPDGASTNVYGGANGGNLSVSHYGKKRNDMAGMGNTTYCNYCHNNASSVFPFINATNNRTIANHSLNYASTNPGCADCHSAGRLHNSTLYRPAFNLSNNTYCLSCHGNNGSGGTNYTSAATSYKEKHNNSLCTDCHLNSSKSIHPVRYLRQNSTWGTANASAVNCTSCHQGTGMNGFGNAPIVQTPIWHSNNSYSGALWNGTQSRFWDNKSQQSSCDYCHGKQALHNLSGLGKSALVQANNSKNQSLSNSYWCVNCHYKGKSPGDEPSPSGKYNYKGDLFSPVPPEIFNLTGLVPANASDGTPFQNHTKNGIGSDWSDDRCQDCHGKDLQAGTTSATFLHNLNKSKPDAGGPDCLKCHPSTANEPDGPPSDRRINKTAFANFSVHRDLNKNANNATALSDNRSKACWACHGDGQEPSAFHPVEFMTPKPCAYCHVSGAFNAPPVSKHYPGSVFSGQKIHSTNFTAGSCQACHNKSQVANLNLTYGTYEANKVINATVSHYATNTSLLQTTASPYCANCHADINQPYGGEPKQLVDQLKHSMNSACQGPCHNPYYYNASIINPVILHNASLGIYYDCYKGGCHTKVNRAPRGGGR